MASTIASADYVHDIDELNGREEAQYLTFRVGEETFGLSILGIKEILEYGGLTTVPMMPACVRGVINLRGRVVPVVDLAVRFGAQASTPGRRTCIVIVDLPLDGGQQDIGVIVDAVHEVQEIAQTEIEPAPVWGAKLNSEFIAGMGKVNGAFVVILRADRALSIDDLAAITPQPQVVVPRLPSVTMDP